MLEYLHSMSILQWLCILAAAAIIFWPSLRSVTGQNDIPRSSVLDDVLTVRRHLGGDEEALNAMDTIVIPAVLRKETK